MNVLGTESFGTKLLTFSDTTALSAVAVYWELGFKPAEVEIVSLYESTETRVKWYRSMWNWGEANMKIVDSDATNNYLYADNDVRQTLPVAFQFTLSGSASNDGAYVVVSTSYDRDTNRTRIAVASVAADNDGGVIVPTLFGGGYVLTHASANWTELSLSTGLRMYDGGDDIVYNNPATPTYKTRKAGSAIINGQVIDENGENVLANTMPAVSNDNGKFYRLKGGILIPALAAIRGNAQILYLIARR